MLTLTPYPYQEDAIDRAIARKSFLFAYEMGLGKTLVAVAAIEELLGSRAVQTCVIVVSASLKYQWAKEIAKITDVDTTTMVIKDDGGQKQEIIVPTERYAIVIDGPPKARVAQYERVKENNPDYVIMGYTNVVDDWNHVRRIRPEAIVLDEITAIKSFKSQRTRKMKRFRAEYQFGLTGTAVENRAEELFSIMQWVDPDVLGRYDLFERAYVERNQFGGIERYKNLDVLHARLSEAMARKTSLDPDVAPYMPELIVDPIYVRLDLAGRALYNRIAMDLSFELGVAASSGHTFDLASHYAGESADDNTQAGIIMSRYQALAMACVHPHLLVHSAKEYADSQAAIRRGEVRATWPGSAYCYQLAEDGALREAVKTPKLDVIVAEVTRALEQHPENKVIILSFYRHMLDLLAEALPFGSAQYHGGMSPASKTAAQTRFQSDPDCRVFIGSDAGRYGVDLPQANYLFDADLPWSDGAYRQGHRRHVRAGSSHERVYARPVLIKGSIEVRQFTLLGFKGSVADGIMDGRAKVVVNSVPPLSHWLNTQSV